MKKQIDKKEIIKRLKELHIFFHHVGMDYTGKLSKKYAISYSNLRLKTQRDFMIAEGVMVFFINHLEGEGFEINNKEVFEALKKSVGWDKKK